MKNQKSNILENVKSLNSLLDNYGIISREATDFREIEYLDDCIMRLEDEIIYDMQHPTE